MPTHALNTILYGPPGTGKTYETARRAVEIIDGSAPEDRKALMARYKELQRQERIAFVTFHQSYAYEDFIEGIRPVMDEEEADGSPRYRIVDGVFKKLAKQAKIVRPISADTPVSGTSDFEFLWQKLLESIDANPDKQYQLGGERDKKSYLLTITDRGNLGYKTVDIGKDNFDEKNLTLQKSLLEKVWNHLFNFDRINSVQANKITEQYKPIYAVVFNEMKNLEEPEPMYSEIETIEAPVLATSNYVLIVDEINRGNISKILGELITLLEDDKRIGEDNELTVTLPYSREPFSLPPNLYLIGTMNTADKSLALLDVALRRRFTFEELTPDFMLCQPALSPEMLKALMELNRRITLRKDRDHRIGHAFFMKIGSDVNAFNAAFRGKVLPLLQEYFFNDWDGVRYVLGERDNAPGFVVALDGGQDKGVRNRWQWYTDTDNASSLQPLAQLGKNYGNDTTA